MNRSDFEKLFDAYLDGLLTGERLARFEELVRKHPGLRARVESQRKLNDSLRRQMAPGFDSERVEAMLATAQPTSRTGRSRRVLLAASIGLVFVVGAAVVYLTNSGPTAAPPPTFTPQKFVYAEPAEVYRELEANGFEPDYVCADDQEFLAYTENKFETAFLVRSAPGVALIGWTKTTVFSSYTGAMMAKAGGRDVVLIVDRVADDRELEDPPGEGLRLFRRTIGDLLLYEITPGDEPAILPLVYQPEAP